ncbi:MAG: hypothetical protein EXR93_09890 [Gemmatimonadetes bacterium]|nr:hypothetical protein [Gemmatimonadota bacterium]
MTRRALMIRFRPLVLSCHVAVNVALAMLAVAAYHVTCAMCRLKHNSLLDAAHIIPDREEHGLAEVPNGLCLCKIHHTAYDVNIVGVDADYRIHVREDVLEEHDGPMFRHGLQEMAG